MLDSVFVVGVNEAIGFHIAPSWGRSRKMRGRKSAGAAIAALALGLFAGHSHGAIIFSDNFTYPDGSLTTVGAPTWTNHSGTVGQVNVTNNTVFLTEGESEDVNAVVSGGPYTSGTLYAGLDINFSALPSLNGGYFFHFKDATTSGFRGRVFATQAGAGAGSFRLGITNGSNAGIVSIPTDINVNESHRLVLAYDTATAIATLYLDATTETGGVVATDVVTTLPITSVALRQSIVSGSGMGMLNADNLLVGTTFADVATVPEPAALGLALFGPLAFARRR